MLSQPGAARQVEGVDATGRRVDGAGHKETGPNPQISWR